MKTIYNNKDMDYKVIALSENYHDARVTIVHNQADAEDMFCEFIVVLGGLTYVLKDGCKFGTDMNRILSSDEKYNMAHAIIKHLTSIERMQAKNSGESYDMAKQVQNYAIMFDHFNQMNRDDIVSRFIK